VYTTPRTALKLISRAWAIPPRTEERAPHIVCFNLLVRERYVLDKIVSSVILQVGCL
jgi:hypothetical protein